MKSSSSFVKRTALMAGIVAVLVGNTRGGQGSPDAPTATNTSPQMTSSKVGEQSGSNDDHQAAIDAGLKMAAQMGEDRTRGVPEPPSYCPLPNYDTGPGRPYPVHVNFYTIHDPHPDYLLCRYDVDEEVYNPSDEPKWFQAALKQIRRSGPKKFPSIHWIAVIIVDRGEWKGSGTFEQGHKVGAIFKATDVFDRSHDIMQLVTNAVMDRHPFKDDTTQPTPAKQRRWIIVEQHAATNNPTTGSK